MSFEFLIIIVLCIVLGVVLAAYERLVRKLDRYERERELIEARSRQKAVKIVEAAKDRAIAILANTKIDAKQSQEDIDKQLEDVSKKQLEYYKELLQNVSKSIEQDTKKEVAEFKKILELETVGAQKTVTDRIEEDYAKAQEQLEAYKRDRMQTIDRKAAEIIKEFTRIALGKGLSMEQQQELLLEALEEAKNQHVI